MTYQEAVNKINSLLRFGMKPGLERVAALLKRLGNPQEKLTCIHVAGTNGKGTTSTLIASVLRAAGYRTGLFTSPFVVEFRERFQINGEMIGKEELTNLLDEVMPIVEQMAKEEEVVTEFELITALALVWFARRECDFVVLEVGLGGRFDATNVIPTPPVAVIASISLDHTAVLGDTVEQIAFEKAGIVKPGGTTVLYPEQEPAVFEVIGSICRQRGNELRVADLCEIQKITESIHGSELIYRGQKLLLPFVGEHQIKNAATALAAIEVLREKGVSLSDEALKTGFREAEIPARMEILSEKPLVLLDGGHNPGCAAALADVLRRYVSDRKIVALMGMMSDKDSVTALSILAPLFSHIITLQPENPRALTSERLAEQAFAFCPKVTPMHDGEAALRAALGEAGATGAVVICGSFFLAGELRLPALKMLRERQKEW